MRDIFKPFPTQRKSCIILKRTIIQHLLNKMNCICVSCKSEKMRSQFFKDSISFWLGTVFYASLDVQADRNHLKISFLNSKTKFQVIRESYQEIPIWPTNCPQQTFGIYLSHLASWLQDMSTLPFYSFRQASTSPFKIKTQRNLPAGHVKKHEIQQFPGVFPSF